MFNLRKGSKGFTLVELMVVMGILAVLMAIVMPAVTGTKSVSVEGQVLSDAKSVQTAVDNFNNKSIKVGAFPEVVLATGTHAYSDVYAAVGGATPGGATLKNKDGSPKGSGETLATPIDVPGKSGTTVAKRTVVNFLATVDTYDSTGAVKTAFFVPDFLGKSPSSIPLMGDDTKALGATYNKIEEFLWLMMVNAPQTDQESRTVEVYRLTDATTCTYNILNDTVSCGSLTYTQIF